MRKESSQDPGLQKRKPPANRIGGKNKRGALKGIFNEHDTPPPVIVTTGSLIVDANTDEPHWSNVTGGTGRRTVSFMPKGLLGNPPTKPIYIAHVKVVDGSGDLLFRLDNDKNSTKGIPVKITALVVGTEDMNLTVNGTKDFIIDVPPGRKMFPKAGDVPQNNRQRVRYMNDASSDAFTVVVLKYGKDRSCSIM